MFWNKNKHPKKVVKTIKFSSEEIQNILDNPSPKYDGKIYTEEELDEYVSEIFEGFHDLEILGKTTKNLAFSLRSMVGTANLNHEYGLNMYKVWHCVCDEKSCPVCKALHGLKIPIEDSFPSKIYVPELKKEVPCGFTIHDKSGRTFKNPCPPFHEGCRCCLLFEPKD